jgi:hypothetical protein
MIFFKVYVLRLLKVILAELNLRDFHLQVYFRWLKNFQIYIDFFTL